MNTARFSTWGMALGLLLAGVLHAPAQWLATGVNAASRGHVQLRDAQGTVWRGNAQWVLTSGPGGQDALALPQRLHWQWQPQWSGLLLQLKADCCTPEPMLLSLQPQWLGVRVSLTSPRSVWPAQWLSGLGAPWNTLALAGVLQLHSENISWSWRSQAAGWGAFSGSAELQLRQLTSGLSTIKPLGSYSLRLQGGDVPSLVLSTTDGPLLMQGRGAFGARGFSFEGQARANTGFESALANLLGVLGQRVGNHTVLRWG
jgi:general secretion pathway protein N